MWPDRRLIDLLGVEHSLVLSPMAGLGTVELAAAVCAGGGLGSLGCVGLEPEIVSGQARTRALAKHPQRVYFLHKSRPAREGVRLDGR
jgi:nitronate monooxygenase